MKVLDINVVGQLNVIKAFLPKMAQNERLNSFIINVSSANFVIYGPNNGI